VCFFGFFIVFDVRKCLPIVLVFLLSSPSFDHEDSDSEHERFQKILSQQFGCRSGLAHGAKIQKHQNSLRGEGLWPEFRHGSCAARNVQINMACRDGFVSNGSVLEQYSATVVANLGERRAD
jgi:hypothetical protein